MFDRLIVLDHHGQQKIFFVPETLSIRQFISNVKEQIASRKHYNDEIQDISRKLKIEQEKLVHENELKITAKQGRELINTFVVNHPLDDRRVEDILEDSGALEICKQIPPQNYIYDD